MKCNFITSTHVIGSSNRRAGDNIALPIKIGDGTWIGANVTILPGVEIGAGLVVNRNCLDNSLYCGNPAKKIRDIEN